MKCPICDFEHESMDYCPECGFERHLLMNSASEEIKQYEQQRIEHAKQTWDKLQTTIKESSINKPIAFLVSERMNVYCLYDGINTFGSSKFNPENKNHQKLILPGMTLMPIHISIKAIQGERRYNFIISAINESNVFLNSKTEQIVSEAVIKDNDCIIIQSGDITASLVFRINLNNN